MSESSHCFQKGNRNSGYKLCIMVCPSFWEDDYMLIYTHCWELMNLVGSHGSSSLLFVMKVMVCHFVSDSHEVMTALIVMLPLIVVVEISLQLHQALIPSPLRLMKTHGCSIWQFMMGLVPAPVVDGKSAIEDKSNNTDGTVKRPAPRAGGCRIEGFVKVKKVRKTT